MCEFSLVYSGAAGAELLAHMDSVTGTRLMTLLLLVMTLTAVDDCCDDEVDAASEDETAGYLVKFVLLPLPSDDTATTYLCFCVGEVCRTVLLLL